MSPYQEGVLLYHGSCWIQGVQKRGSLPDGPTDSQQSRWLDPNPESKNWREIDIPDACRVTVDTFTQALSHSLEFSGSDRSKCGCDTESDAEPEITSEFARAKRAVKFPFLSSSLHATILQCLHIQPLPFFPCLQIRVARNMCHAAEFFFSLYKYIIILLPGQGLKDVGNAGSLYLTCPRGFLQR